MKNKVINVNLTGGLIGLLGDSPQQRLNTAIFKASEDGWNVVQVIPAASANLLLSILRFLLLIVTLGIFTLSQGYYIIVEKK